MNETINSILTRRSCRSYTDEPVSREALDEIIRCGLYAPSAMNRQLWQFTAVVNPGKISALQSAFGTALGNDAYRGFYGAPAVIIVTVPADYILGVQDTACAMENMMLAAHSLGLASVWVNQINGICADEEVRKCLDGFGIPSEHIGYAVLAVGHPAAKLPDDRPCRGVCKIID